MSKHKKFHVENDVIITTKDEIDVEEVFNFLRGRLSEFRDESQFVVICGFHTSKSGEIGQIDHDLTYDYQEMFERFHNAKKNPEVFKIVQEKRFQMGSVFPVGSIRDWSQKNEVYLISEQSKSQIKIKFEEIKETQKPIVLIVASCWSYWSQISTLLQLNGIFSVLNISEERCKLTAGRLFRLHDEQKNFLKFLTQNLGIKDIIIYGNYFNKLYVSMFLGIPIYHTYLY